MRGTISPLRVRGLKFMQHLRAQLHFNCLPADTIWQTFVFQIRVIYQKSERKTLKLE